MTWIAAIAVALVAFAIAVFVMRLATPLWTSLLATLAFGLAGYALQASPDLPSAPKAADTRQDRVEFDIVAARRALVGEAARSRNGLTVTADGMARQGQYANAAALLSGVTEQNPQDFDAWIGQGNALVEHAGGTLTPAAVFAYRKAVDLQPDHPAPGYFLGATLIRQGRLMEARQVWLEALEAAPADAVGRPIVAMQLARLEEALEVPEAERTPIEASTTEPTP